MTKTLDPRTVTLVQALNDAPPSEIFGYGEFGADAGKRYDRVWYGGQGYGHAVKCFVDRQTGQILYAAGWTAPKKWGGVNASEFHTDESDLYALAVSEGLWGYKGDRAKWEKRRGVFPS